MSAPTAVAAVTATLKRLLSGHLPEQIAGKQVRVTSDPPSRFPAPGAAVAPQLRLNLFLYDLRPNAAGRNQPPPNRGTGATAAQAPLVLDAYYLLTAYPTADDPDGEVQSQQLLGRGLLVLHDVPILGAESVRLAPPDPPLDFYGERVRVVPHPLSVDEMSKLWSTFQAPYRLSVALQVSVILIDSTKETRPPPPVLSRGEPAPDGQSDHGVIAASNLELPYPNLTAVDLAADPDDPARRTRPKGLPVFEIGETVRLTGGRLKYETNPVTVVLTPASGGPAIELVAPKPGSTAKQLDVELRSANHADRPLRAGTYTVSARVATGEAVNPERLTNELPLLIAPRVTAITPDDGVGRDDTLTVAVQPGVGEGQRVTLLLGDVSIGPNAFPPGATGLDFDLSFGDLVPGRTYPLRLRVGGVDSLPTRPERPLQFEYTVTIQ